MPQSLADVLLHIVFSTKNRGPLLKTSELRWTLGDGVWPLRGPAAFGRVAP